MINIDDFKKVFMKNFYGKYFVSLLHCFESKIMPHILNDEKVIKRLYKKWYHKDIDLNNPVTFSEKENWYKLNVRTPLMQQCADKFAVREYIKSKGYEDLLNELFGVFYDVKDIDIQALPDKFILKAAHGSHMNIIVNSNKDKFDWKKEKMMMNTWLHQDIYWGGREWVYKDMPKRIVAEKFLVDQFGELRDYKFFCFNGIPKIMYIATDRFGLAKNTFFDMDFNKLDLISSFHPAETSEIKKPANFEKMKKIAADLSEPFQFVRVDLYDVNGKIYFGEMTFYQDGGNPGYSHDWDVLLGNEWNIAK